MNDDCKTKVVQLTETDALDKYKHSRLIDGIRTSTIDRIEYAIKTLYSIVGEFFPIKNLKTTHIDGYKKYWLNIPKMDIMDTFSMDTKLLSGLSVNIEHPN